MAQIGWNCVLSYARVFGRLIWCSLLWGLLVGVFLCGVLFVDCLCCCCYCVCSCFVVGRVCWFVWWELLVGMFLYCLCVACWW